MTRLGFVFALAVSTLLLGHSHAGAQTWRYATEEGRGGFVRNTGPAWEAVRIEINCDDGGGTRPLLMSLDLLRPRIDEGIRSLTFRVDRDEFNHAGRAYPTFHESGWMNWTVTFGVSGKGPLIASLKRGSLLQARMIDQAGATKQFSVPLDGFTAAWRGCEAVPTP